MMFLGREGLWCSFVNELKVHTHPSLQDARVSPHPCSREGCRVPSEPISPMGLLAMTSVMKRLELKTLQGQCWQCRSLAVGVALCQLCNDASSGVRVCLRMGTAPWLLLQISLADERYRIIKKISRKHMHTHIQRCHFCGALLLCAWAVTFWLSYDQAES